VAIATGHMPLIHKGSNVVRQSTVPDQERLSILKSLTMGPIVTYKKNQESQLLMPAIQPANYSLAQLHADGATKLQ